MHSRISKDTTMLRSLTALTIAIALATTGCAGLKSKPKAVEAVMTPTDGNSAAGTLRVTVVPDGVHIQGRLTGLTPGSTHGFHIHEHGDCSAPDASTAGGHFNPTKTEHGDPAGMTHHSGDIANQIADAQGTIDVDVTVHGVSFDSGLSDDVLGRALIVHRDADDYTSQPAGNSGPRIACGVILKKP
jgi:Cu-Zn family superoxide dismutase